MDFGSDKFGQIRVGQKRTKGDSVGQKRTDEDSGQDRTISVRTILLAGILQSILTKNVHCLDL